MPVVEAQDVDDGGIERVGGRKIVDIVRIVKKKCIVTLGSMVVLERRDSVW